MKRLICLISLVLLVTALASCGAQSIDGFAVPSDMSYLASETGDYYLIYPQNWLTETTVGMTSVYTEDAYRSSVIVTANELPAEMTSIEQYWEQYTEQFRAQFSDFEMVDPEPSDVTVGKEQKDYGGVTAEGKKYRYRATVGDVEYQWSQVFFLHNATLYTVTYTAKAAVYDSHTDDVDKILAYFAIR